MLFLDIQGKEWSPEPNISIPTHMIYKIRKGTKYGVLLIMMKACTQYLIPILMLKHILSGQMQMLGYVPIPGNAC
jgi:hypothetical protein